MSHTHNRNRPLTGLFLAVLLALYAGPAHAATNMPPLETFIEQVQNGDAATVRGIYAPGLFADAVAQQPHDDPAFVSSEEDTVTQFGLAASHGSIGLLAHNSLAGQNFFALRAGQIFLLIYGDGSRTAFRVTRLLRARALNPESIRSNFIDLDTGHFLTAARLFDSVYDQPGRLILQTCIEAEGDPSWGRLFVIAEPYAEGDPGQPLLFEAEARGYGSILNLATF